MISSTVLPRFSATLAGERKGRFCAGRQAWLDAKLAEQPDRPTLLFIHHPPFDVDDHYIGGYRELVDLDTAGKLDPLLREEAAT